MCCENPYCSSKYLYIRKALRTLFLMHLKIKGLRFLVHLKLIVSSYRIDRPKTIILTFLVIINIWMIWSLNVYKSWLLDSTGDSGSLGDSYGVITSFFSALAFAGLLYTILLQRKELSETRKEFEKQNTNLKRQRFESSFFNMIEIHLNNLKSLDFKGQNGTRAIQQFIASVLTAFQPYLEGVQHNQSRENVYNDALKHFSYIISPYVRSLTAIYDITINSSLQPKAKKRYVRILKAYISTIESEFLFYHSTFCYTDDLNERELSLLKKFMQDSGLEAEVKTYVRSKRSMVF